MWRECKATKTPYYPPTYQSDGFIHLTAQPALLLEVANHFYSQEAGEWIVLCIDDAKLCSKVVFEPAMPVGDKPTSENFGNDKEQQLFPHLYGTIDFEAVSDEVAMVRSETNGAFLSIPGLAAGP